MYTSFKYNVFYDLEESNIYYDYDNLRFYFSSELLKNAFIKRLEKLKIDKQLFENNYRVKLKNDNLFLLKYYNKTEKRGFRVEDLKSLEDVYKFEIIIEA